MAIQRVGINFDFNANTKQAESNLNALEKTMMRLENRMRTMGAPNDPTSSRRQQGAYVAQQNLLAFGEETIDLKTPIRQTEILTDNIRKGKIGWDEYGRAVKNNSAIVTQQLANQTGQIHSVTAAGKGFQAVFTPNSMLRGVSGIEVATARMNAFGEATKAVSQHTIDMGKNLAFSARQMTVSLTMPMAIMGGLAIKQFTDIDKQLTDIAKVYDATADGVEVSTGRIRASMKDLARELSRTQGAEIKDTLDIAQFYAQQGKVGEELRESTIQASRLMTLGDVDINDAQKTITTLTAVVGANAKELGKYVDYLNKVEDSTQLTMQDFAQTLPTIAPLVKTFVPDDKDLLMSTSASMMEASRRAGFEPKESMNAWKSMYGSFVRPAKSTEEKFATLTGKYGKEQDLRKLVAELGGNPVDILSRLAEMTKEWSTVDRGELITQLTGKWQLSRGLGIMQALNKDVGNNDVAIGRMEGINKELVNNPEQLADNSKRQMDLIRNSAHTQLQQLKQDVQFMFADLGERIFIPVMESLNNVLGLAKTAYNAMSSIPEPLKDIISIGAQLTFIAGPVLAAFAATKMLAGFAGRLAGSFASTAASAARIGASMMGTNMKGTGKLESKQQSIARLQEKDNDMLSIEMEGAVDAENAARMRGLAVIDEKNAKIRETINLQRELNRAMTGTITPDNTPVKDPKKDLDKYKASLSKPTQDWPMAIQAKDIGPESFRRHAGRIGAPATRVQGVGLDGNKVFGSSHGLGAVSLVPKTDATTGGISNDTKQYIQKELDKVNAGIAIKKDIEERNQRQIAELRAERPAAARKGTRGAANINKQRAEIDDKISGLRKENQALNRDGKVAGLSSYGIPTLEKQRAQLLQASNGNSIQQSKIMAQLMAQQKNEVSLRQQQQAAIVNETKQTGLRAQMLAGIKGAPGALKNYAENVKNRDAAGHRAQQARGAENIRTFVDTARNTEWTRFGEDKRRFQESRRSYRENTLRGGTGEYFRGSITPRDVRVAQKSDAMKEIRFALNKMDDDAFDIKGLIKENEDKRNKFLETATKAYKDQGMGDIPAHQAAQKDLAKSNLPTANALQRETDIYSQQMITRAEKLEERQLAIAEGAGEWSEKITAGAAGVGLIGTMLTSTLGIQNQFVDGALAFSNILGAVGMMAPSIMEKAVSSFATFGSGLIDKFDASGIGTRLGAALGDTMGTTASSKISSVMSTVGSGLMAAVPYIAAAGLALLAIKGIWDIHRRDSEKYVKSLDEANRSVELHAELLGYVRKEQKDIADMTYQEATTKRAEAYRNNEDGKSNFVREIASADSQTEINTILSREAIRILDDNGTDADVRSMVDAALEAAGIRDEKTVAGVKLAFKDFEVNVDTAAAESVMKKVSDSVAGVGTAASSGDAFARDVFTIDVFSNMFESEEDRIKSASENLSGTAQEAAETIASDMAAAINQASNEEEKAAIANRWIEAINEGRKRAEESGNVEAIGASIGIRKTAFDQLFGKLESNDAAAALDMADGVERLKDNMIVLQAVAGGEFNPDFDTPAEAGEKYKEALAQIEAVHGELSDEEKKSLHNAIAYAGGMKVVAKDVDAASANLGVFEQSAKKVNEQLAMTAGSTSASETMDAFASGINQEDLDIKAERVKGLNYALANVPGEFHKRWKLEIEADNPESIDAFMNNLRTATVAGQKYAADEASRQFKDRQDAAFNAIKSETDGAMKSMDAKQKASEKAFTARSKALDAQFKGETKALDKQHNEEKKAYDKQQKERDKEFNKRQRDDQRAYDKAQKAQDKQFNKQQQAERKAFDKSWDEKADAITSAHENAIKAIEDQGKAEERLEQLRQRNAERERKRREFLNNMANTNIDINVAVAGGNLDEAARLSNNATSAASDYYQDAIDSEAAYELQDRGDARQKRIEGIGISQSASMDEFGRLREGATEGFEDSQTLAQEKREEEMQLARDIYEEKKALEAEQYEEQKAIEAERFAERQALEKERLQAEQEARREALEAEKAAVAERHAAEREMIQETARQKEEGARRHFEATQRSLDMEMEALLADIPENIAAREQWIKDVEATYARHGVYLNSDFAPKVNEGMSKAMVASLDKASNEMMSNRNWAALGEEIGLQLKNGTLKGYLGEQIAEGLIFGKIKNHPPASTKADNRSNRFAEPFLHGPRAGGGPISGPGTGTSDSILARLSNGEHVLTAAEVRKMGGHAAVERMRQSIKDGNLPAFATGGGVGTSATAPGSNSELNVRVASTGTGEVADGGVMAAITNDVTNMGTAFDATLTNTVAPAWKLFGETMVAVKNDSIDPVLEGSKIALQEYANQTNQIMSANMNPAWVQFGQNLKMVKEGVWDVVMTDMKAGISSLSASISTAIGNEIMPKWTEGSNHVRNMQDTVIAPAMQQTRDATTQTAQNFGTAADMIGTGWGRVKENSASPVRYTIGTVYNDGLVGMWNKVADALDLDKMDRHEFSFATGGVMPGYTPGRDVHHFSSPTGGKLHLSGGEAIMRPEWTRAVGGPSAVAQMNNDAKSGKVQRFADGGVVDAPGGGRAKGRPKKSEEKKEKPAAIAYGMPKGTQISYGAAGFPAWVYNIANQFGLQASTYPGHQENNVNAAGFMPNPALQNRGIDWSGPVDKMHTFAQYLVANGPSMPQLEQVIWMHPSTGQKIGWFGNGPDLGGSIYARDYGGHADHVHTRQSQSLDGTGSMDGVILGLGGMGVMIDPKIIAAVNTFNEEKSKLKEKIAAHMDAGRDTVMNSIPGKVFTEFTGAMDKKIQAVMPLLGGGSIGAYGLNHQDHVREIIAAAHEKGLPREAARIAIATALVESELRMLANPVVPDSFQFPHEGVGTDHTSVGIFQQQKWWGTTAQRMNARASAGMFYDALTKFDWRGMDPGAAAQKVQVSAFPDKYATRMAEADALIEMVGGFDSNVAGAGPADDKDKLKPEKKFGGSGGKFDQGGIAQGMGMMNKAVISPERVLSPRQTAAFEKLVPAMDRVADGGLSEQHFMAKNTFDRNAAFNKMIERESQAKIDFTNILEKLQPYIATLTGALKSQVVPGITGYANDLIKLDNDSQRIDKVATDIINAITGIQVPEINTDMQMNIGGNIYGDAQLNATLERWKQDIIQTVQMQQALAQQAIGGK